MENKIILCATILMACLASIQCYGLWDNEIGSYEEPVSSEFFFKWCFQCMQKCCWSFSQLSREQTFILTILEHAQISPPLAFRKVGALPNTHQKGFLPTTIALNRPKMLFVARNVITILIYYIYQLTRMNFIVKAEPEVCGASHNNCRSDCGKAPTINATDCPQDWKCCVLIA